MAFSVSLYNIAIVASSLKLITILPLVNFPGYIAVDNTGREVNIEENGNHMMQLSLTEGSGEIKIWYKGLPLFAVADSISLVSTMGVLILISFVHKNRYWNRLLG